MASHRRGRDAAGTIAERKEMTMHDHTVPTAWQRFLDKVKGFWRKPVERDLAATIPALRERAKEIHVTLDSPGVSQR